MQVRDFWPRYWGGVVLLDPARDFYKALGWGKLQKENFLSGFFLNPRAISNYKRAKSMEIEYNFKGEGEIKGGLFIIGSGKTGIAYQFIERNFGDWAPLAEVIEICTQLQVINDSCFLLMHMIISNDASTYKQCRHSKDNQHAPHFSLSSYMYHIHYFSSFFSLLTLVSVLHYADVHESFSYDHCSPLLDTIDFQTKFIFGEKFLYAASGSQN